jgi:hypothetical protein
MSNLERHARDELNRARMFDSEGDFYDGMLGEAVMELIQLFAKQGHSGMSGSIAIHLFTELANFNPLTPITDDPSEWNEVGEGRWQCARRGDAFSSDGGKTYRITDERRKWLRQLLPFKLYRRLPEWVRFPIHKSVPAA